MTHLISTSKQTVQSRHRLDGNLHVQRCIVCCCLMMASVEALLSVLSTCIVDDPFFGCAAGYTCVISD